MKLEHLSPFIQAALEAVQKTTTVAPTRGSLSYRACPDTTQQVTLPLTATGALEGIALYGVSVVTAIRLSALMVGKPLDSLDAMALGALTELAKTISTEASEALKSQGLSCEITPGDILRPARTSTGFLLPGLVIPLTTSCGLLEIFLSVAPAASPEAEEPAKKAA